MGSIDLVVTVGADQQQMLHLRLDQQILDQIEGGRIEPLQIVEEQDQGVFRSSEDADKPTEDHLEATLCFLRRKNWKWRLLSYDQLQFRNQIHHQPPVWT